MPPAPNGQWTHDKNLAMNRDQWVGIISSWWYCSKLCETISTSHVFNTASSKTTQCTNVGKPVRSLWLESAAWWWALVSARSFRCAGPFDVTLDAVVRDSLPLCAGWPLLDAFCWSDGSNEFSATSRFPPECWRAAVACCMLKPISTIVAMFLSDCCCNDKIQANMINTNDELQLLWSFLF